MADFSGVCSGDIYVLETKDAQSLLPELLPFICQDRLLFRSRSGHVGRITESPARTGRVWRTLSCLLLL